MKQIRPHKRLETSSRRSKKNRFNNTRYFMWICMTACLLAVCAMILYIRHSGDVSDTTAGKLISSEDEGRPSVHSPEPITEYIRISDLTEEAALINDTDVTSAPEILPNPYPDLSVPTWITRVEDTYFLVDCYHNQVIYHDNLTDPLTEWSVMTSDIDRGHTLASDGTVYLVDDTERHRILIFEKKDGAFIHTQTFNEIGNRPHYIVYDDSTDTFYAWSSMSGEMYLLRHNPGDTRMYLTEIRRIESLDDVYVRSFTIMDDEIYFVSGSSSIIRASLADFEILECYPVPDSMAGMIQLTKIQDYFYITVSTDLSGSQDYATILRTRDLAALTKGDYEDIYDQFIGGGTPYYISEFDNTYYLTEHRLPGHSVWSFRVEENRIKEVKLIY